MEKKNFEYKGIKYTVYTGEKADYEDIGNFIVTDAKMYTGEDVIELSWAGDGPLTEERIKLTQEIAAKHPKHVLVQKVGISVALDKVLQDVLDEEAYRKTLYEYDKNMLHSYLDNGWYYFNDYVEYQEGYAMLYTDGVVDCPDLPRDFSNTDTFPPRYMEFDEFAVYRLMRKENLLKEFEILAVDVPDKDCQFGVLIQKIDKDGNPIKGMPRADILFTLSRNILLDGKFVEFSKNNFYAAFGCEVGR